MAGLFDVTGQCLDIAGGAKGQQVSTKSKASFLSVAGIGRFVVSRIWDRKKIATGAALCPAARSRGQRQIEPVRHADYNWFNFLKIPPTPLMSASCTVTPVMGSNPGAISFSATRTCTFRIR
jgi:hypothetical protein